MLRVLIHALAAALLSVVLASVLIRIPPTSPMSHPHSTTRPSHHAATAAHIRSSIASYVSEIKSGANALDAAAAGGGSGKKLADRLRTRARGIRDAVEANKAFLEDMARLLEAGEVSHAESSDGSFSVTNTTATPISVILPPPAGITLPPYKFASYDSPQTLMGHLARDWTEEGYANTAKTYDIVRDMLKRHLPPTVDGDHPTTANGNDATHTQRVLLPGGGLSRLAFDLALEGYDVECNDLSPLMATVSALILSHSYSSTSSSSSTASLPTIYPHLHRPKNLFHGDTRDQLTPQLCPFPSPSALVSARLAQNLPFHPVKISIGGYATLYAGERADEQPDPDDQGFDGCPKCVAARERKRAAARAAASSASPTSPHPHFSALVASFFLDRAHAHPLTLLRYMLTPLLPGGILIVLGPLAWRADARPMMTWDEVKVWWEEEGLEVLEETTVAGEYARGEGMMM
ncbi:hypothetical protein M427DRAFT_31483 [Gonapodya prolifera JEL478]|uniref:carnosine N-methyltransferase n=1 Tax=Gonapodya prolifera (strain JEL478) TaxID=1344416 RepID=A0A139AI29_GONPJ|nr:hypothetical protein M427DRAFT_31483 [Gonapodya prolifera JEL478]|eukprot:KXS16349.1 hypothetical protein M427DRAFT_31483 [Gonapodya prolifera JEL478]